MSPLWMNQNTKQRKTFQKKPSPKHFSDERIYAQKLFIDILLSSAIKGISLFISRFRRLEAGMTVEAAVVLPLFLFFFLNLGSAIEMIRLHNNLEFALCDIGKRMSIYGYALTASEENPEDGERAEREQENEWLAELKDVGLSYTYVKKELVDYLGRDYLEEAPIVNGVDGLQFLESEIFDGNDCFELVVTYRVAPFGELAGFKGFRMANKYYGHLWNGYHIPGTEGDADGEDVVYVAEYGSVYHEEASCTHLFLTVREVSLQEAYESRNSNGAKYELCQYCGENNLVGRVYITEDGDRIHYQKDCTGLKRTVYEIPREEADGYTPCTRCAKVQ